LLSYHFVREAIASGNYALLFVWLNVFLRSDGNCGIFSHHISLRDDITNNIHTGEHQGTITFEEFGETSTSRLHHIIRLWGDPSVYESYILLALLGIDNEEDTNQAQFRNENVVAILSARVGYGITLLIGMGTILVSIGFDTCAMSIARYTPQNDGEPNIYVLHDRVSSDLLCCGHHRGGTDYGKRWKRVLATRELLDASHNFASCCHQINVGCSLGSSTIYRCHSFDGFPVDYFARRAMQETNSVPISDGYDQPQLHDLYSTNSKKVKLVQHTTSTGQIADYQELLEEPSVVETTSRNNMFTAQGYFEITNYLLKWGAWNRIADWLRNVMLLQKAMSADAIVLRYCQW